MTMARIVAGSYLAMIVDVDLTHTSTGRADRRPHHSGGVAVSTRLDRVSSADVCTDRRR